MEIQGLYFWFCGHQCVVGRIEWLPQDIFILPLLQPFILYIRSQTNKEFVWIVNAWHYLPYVVYFVFNFGGLLLGKNVVEPWKNSGMIGT